MYEWNTIPWRKLEKEVFKLQKRIYQASERGDVRRVRKLQKLLCNSWSARTIAVRKVTQDNRGKRTAGVDGRKSLNPKQRMELVKKLQIGNKAKPTRRIWIPKPGQTEKRPLGIPTMSERAKQALVKMALEPEWEAKFESNSYGFRPGRSCHDAIAAIHKALCQKDKYILDADIAKCFEKIDHRKLLEKVNTYPKLTRQLKAWLKSGVMDGGELFPTTEGTPQGGVCSPLLANIALHGLETMIEKSLPRRQTNSKGIREDLRPPNVIRYADDFVIMHPDIEVIKQSKTLIERWLGEMGLQLKPEKTRISHSLYEYEGNQGFEFLGFHIQHREAGRYKSAHSSKGKPLGHKLHIAPSKKSIKQHLEELERIIKRNKTAKAESVINQLNPIIKGWSRYYSGVISSEIFKLLNHLIYQKLRRWANRRHPNKGKRWVKDKYWKTIGNQNWVFSETQDGEVTNTLVNHSDTKIVRHIKVRGKKSPYDGDFIYWSQRMSQHPEASTRIKTLLKKQKGKCAICNRLFTTEDIMEIDHIIPRSQKGRDEYRNLQLLHAHCHDKKSAEDARRYSCQ